MNNLLFTDTETTGFKKSGLMVAGQARVCQTAMIMTDEMGKVLCQFSCLVKPNGWQITDGAYACHGISQKDCEKHGLDQPYFIGMFLALAAQCKMVVAHNKKFDEAMIDVEMAYYKEISTATEAIARKVPWYCTQENSKDICSIPPTAKMKAAGRHHYKTPSLAEAYFHFTGKHIEGAHDAMVDAKACMEIYFGIRGIKIAA